MKNNISDDFIIEKLILNVHKKSIKMTKNSILFNNIYIGLCILNIVLEIFNIIKDLNNWHSYLWLIGITLWTFAIYVTIKTIKKQKIQQSKNINQYYDYLKELDYTAYIKEFRLKKLKKLKYK
jgi:hypothetical protein